VPHVPEGDRRFGGVGVHAVDTRLAAADLLGCVEPRAEVHVGRRVVTKRELDKAASRSKQEGPVPRRRRRKSTPRDDCTDAVDVPEVRLDERERLVCEQRRIAGLQLSSELDGRDRVTSRQCETARPTLGDARCMSE